MRTSCPRCRRCAGGSRNWCPPASGPARSSSAPAVCATSSSPCSCCSWCTAATTTRCTWRRRSTRWPRWAAGGYVGRDDAANLTASYEFLRLLEHRLQLQRLKRTHMLPEADDDEAHALAGPCRAHAARRSARRARRAARGAQAPEHAGVAAARQALLPTAAGIGGRSRRRAVGRPCPPRPPNVSSPHWVTRVRRAR